MIARLLGYVAVPAAAFFLATTLRAQQFTSGDWTYTLNASDEATIVGYSGLGGEVTIPSTLDGKTVKQVGGSATNSTPIFGANNTSVISVTIPDNVTTIGRLAFAQSKGLTNATLGSGVTTIGEEAFFETALSRISIPEGVTTIGDNAFGLCTSLISVRLPESVTSLGVGAFSFCTSLASVTIGAGLTHIAEGAFIGTALSSITIPYNVVNIGNWAFASCADLTSVSVPDSVTSLGDVAFGFCSSLATVTIGTGLSHIGEDAFVQCAGLTAVLFCGDVPSTTAVNIFSDISTEGTIYYLQGANGWEPTFGGWPTQPLTESEDFDNDGVSDAAELAMHSLGFDWQIAQPNLVNTLFANANRAGLYDSATIIANASSFGLYTQSQYIANYSNGISAGVNVVLSNPSSYNLYTSNSIMDLRMGGLMIQRQGTNATVVFQPQTTTDLGILPFTNNGTPITNMIPMPGNKGFIRINAKPNPTPVVN